MKALLLLAAAAQAAWLGGASVDGPRRLFREGRHQ